MPRVCARKVTFYVFPIVANLTSIPVNSIFQRLNLTSQGVHRYLASFLAVVLPWLIAMPLYYGQGYLDLALWSGVLVTSTVNFIIPPALYIIAIRSWNRSRSTAALHGQEEGGALEDEEEEAQEPPKEEDEEEEDGEGGADGGGGGVGERLKREEAVDDDVWHVLPPRYQHLQLALGVVVLVTMVYAPHLTHHPPPLSSRSCAWAESHFSPLSLSLSSPPGRSLRHHAGADRGWLSAR